MVGDKVLQQPECVQPPPPLRKYSPFAAQLKIAFRQFLFQTKMSKINTCFRPKGPKHYLLGQHIPLWLIRDSTLQLQHTRLKSPGQSTLQFQLDLYSMAGLPSFFIQSNCSFIVVQQRLLFSSNISIKNNLEKWEVFLFLFEKVAFFPLQPFSK